MPTYIRPARVVVDDDDGGLAAIAGIVALVLIVSAAAAVIEDIVTALLIAAAVAVLGSVSVLAIVLRRHGVALVQRPPAPARPPVPRPATVAVQAISAPRPLAIEPPAMQLTVLTPEPTTRRRIGE